MAVTTTTTLTELVNAEFINPAILEYAIDYVVAAPFVNALDLRGKATKVGSFPKWVLDSAADVSAETDDITTTTELETTDVQITAAEIGLRRDITDAALEETIIGSQLFDFIAVDAARLAAVALDDDICALFAGLNGGTAVGTSTADLTIANMVQAQATVRQGKMRGRLVYILDDQQALDLQAAAAAGTGTILGSFISLAMDGTTESGYLGTFMGADVWTTGLCDTANTGANVVGACFIRGDTHPLAAAFGMVMTRDVRLASERDESARSTSVVMTAKWGVGEISDASGVPIVTDA